MVIPEAREFARQELATTTPADLLKIAVTQNLDIDKLTALMDLQMRWEANEARKAFVLAMNEFKANPPTITKNRHVSFGTGDRATGYNHATLDHVCEAVCKSLSAHGISHRWKTEQTEGKISVTCVLTHQMGHSESTTLSGGADTSGSKNAIQAIGSTVTYLQRYTLLAATGLAAENTDNDAVTLTDELAERLEWIANCRNLAELKRIYDDAYKLYEDNPNYQKLIVAAKDKKKKELS